MDDPTAACVPPPACDALRASGDRNPACSGLHALHPA